MGWLRNACFAQSDGDLPLKQRLSDGAQVPFLPNCRESLHRAVFRNGAKVMASDIGLPSVLDAHE